MDVHKPKPWHGLREFLKEYVIIVVGVLTALGAEQAVQTLHENRIADEARESIRAEVRENLFWLERRANHQPCVRQQYTEIGQVLDRARHGQPYPTPRQLDRVFHAKLTSVRWEANSQAGRASLFSPVEQRNLGNMYYTTEQYARAQDIEEDVWSKLDAIEGLDHLTPQEIDAFAMLLAEARYQNVAVNLNLMRARQWATVLRLKPENPTVTAVPTGAIAPVACASISAAPDPAADDGFH